MNSKLNTFLLIVVIIILVIGLLTLQKKSKSDPIPAQTADEDQTPEYDGSADQVGTEITPVSDERMSNDPHVQSAVSGAVTMPANFAGHYVIIYVGCGTSCASPTIYDKNTGKLYSIDSSVLAGAVSDPQSGDIIQVYSTVDSDILTIPKRGETGVYNAKYRLVGTTLVEVQ